MMTIREVRDELYQLGFTSRPGSDGHEIWSHPQRTGRRITLAGNGNGGASSLQVEKLKRYRRFHKGTMVYVQQSEI